MFRFPFVVALALALSLFFTGAASAAPRVDSGLSGTIDLAASSAGSESAGPTSSATTASYGDTVWFATTVNGKAAAGSLVYVSLVCSQGASVVYQWSALADFGFPLTDLAGQGLEWDGNASDCTASLIYRVEKGRNVEITILDQASFAVSGVATS